MSADLSLRVRLLLKNYKRHAVNKKLFKTCESVRLFPRAITSELPLHPKCKNFNTLSQFSH